MHVLEIIQVIYKVGSIFWSRVNILTILSKPEKTQMFF